MVHPISYFLPMLTTFVFEYQTVEGQMVLASANSRGINDMLLENKTLSGGILMKLTNLNTVGCLKECLRRPRCKSMNYYLHMSLCELNYKLKTDDGVRLTNRIGVVYTEASNWNEVSNSIIYWTPKETLQSSLLYYFKKCNNMALLHFVKVELNVFWGQMPNLNLVQWRDTFYVDLNVLHDLHDTCTCISTSGYYEGENN